MIQKKLLVYCNNTFNLLGIKTFMIINYIFGRFLYSWSLGETTEVLVYFRQCVTLSSKRRFMLLEQQYSLLSICFTIIFKIIKCNSYVLLGSYTRLTYTLKVKLVDSPIYTFYLIPSPLTGLTNWTINDVIVHVSNLNRQKKFPCHNIHIVF